MVHRSYVGALVKRNEVVAKRKGWLAAAAAGGSVATLVLGPAILGVLGLAGAGYLAYDWFSFRAKHGLRL